jgi:hypothetical protein
VRSWPDASCTAPKVPATARVAKTALNICDMLVCPSPHGDHGHNPGRPKGGPALFDHLTVYEIFAGGGNDSRGPESSRQPVIPPAPLTGDVGRDRGDAGRALLFYSVISIA